MATTVREMQIRVTQRLKHYEDVGLVIESDQLLEYLYRAQEDLLVDIIREEEKTANVVDNILVRLGGGKRFIKTSSELTPVVETGDILQVPYLVSFSLPSDFLYYINCIVFMTRNGSSGAYTEGQLIDYMELGAHVTTETNIPYIRRPKIALKESDYINVLYDFESAVTKIQLVYVRKPKKFSITVDDANFTTTVEINDEMVDDILNRFMVLYLNDYGTREAIVRLMNENLIPQNNIVQPNRRQVREAVNES